jgi:hypothetical protein
MRSVYKCKCEDDCPFNCELVIPKGYVVVVGCLLLCSREQEWEKMYDTE